MPFLIAVGDDDVAATMISSELKAFETHGIALNGANRLHAHSEGKGWKNVYASLATESPWSGSLPAVPHHCVVYCLNKTAKVERTIGADHPRTANFLPRNLAIIPGELQSHWNISGRPDILLLYISKPTMDSLMQGAFGETASYPSIMPRMAFNDPVLEQLSLAVLEGLRGDRRSSGFYIDQMATAIAARLISHHARFALEDDEDHDAVASGSNGRLQRVCSYIDNSLAESPTLQQLAAEAHLSQDHLIRTFKTYLGVTPHQYVINRRIEKAKELLISTSMPISELALSTGFSDQSHLTTVFSKTVGLSPARYRSLNKVRHPL